MNGRQFSFGTSGHPLAQILAAIVMSVALVAAVLMGAFVIFALVGFFAIGYAVLAIRAWWRARTGGGPSGGGAGGSGSAKGIRYIEGEYEVIDTDADAERRRSGTR